MIKYKEIDIDILTTNFNNGVAIIPLLDGSIDCISEQDATQEELEIIQQIKEDVENRPKPEIVEVKPQPTDAERISALETLALQLGGII